MFINRQHHRLISLALITIKVRPPNEWELQQSAFSYKLAWLLLSLRGLKDLAHHKFHWLLVDYNKGKKDPMKHWNSSNPIA